MIKNAVPWTLGIRRYFHGKAHYVCLSHQEETGSPLAHLLASTVSCHGLFGIQSLY